MSAVNKIEENSWKHALTDLNPSLATWQRRAIRHLREIETFKDLLSLLGNIDANTRLVAAQTLGDLNDVLTHDQRAAVIDALLPLLEDPACNDFEYGTWQGDDEPAISVSATAAEALVKLGYAKDSAATLQKARSKGVIVKDATSRE